MFPWWTWRAPAPYPNFPTEMDHPQPFTLFFDVYPHPFWMWLPSVSRCMQHFIRDLYENQLYFKGYDASQYNISGYWEPFWVSLTGQHGSLFPLFPGAVRPTPLMDVAFGPSPFDPSKHVISTDVEDSSTDGGWEIESTSSEESNAWGENLVPTFLSLNAIKPQPHCNKYCIPKYSPVVSLRSCHLRPPSPVLAWTGS